VFLGFFNNYSCEKSITALNIVCVCSKRTHIALNRYNKLLVFPAFIFGIVIAKSIIVIITLPAKLLVFANKK